VRSFIPLRSSVSIPGGRRGRPVCLHVAVAARPSAPFVDGPPMGACGAPHLRPPVCRQTVACVSRPRHRFSPGIRASIRMGIRAAASPGHRSRL